MTQQPDKEFERWAREHNLGDLSSPTTRQLYENRQMTVEEYIAKFRKGRISRVLRAEAKAMLVAEALKSASRNVSKLLINLPDKFEKSGKTMKLRSDAKNELIELLRQEIGRKVTEALETDNAQLVLSTLSFQSTAYPERHIWVDTDLDGIGIDLEDWNIEEEWDNAVARVKVDSLEDAVEIIQIWLSGGELDNYANVGLEYEKVLRLSGVVSS